MSGKSVLRLGRGRDGNGLSVRILPGILRQQRRHGSGLLAHLLDGAGEPAFDRAIHQAVGEPEHDDYGKEREQKIVVCGCSDTPLKSVIDALGRTTAGFSSASFLYIFFFKEKKRVERIMVSSFFSRSGLRHAHCSATNMEQLSFALLFSVHCFPKWDEER